MYLELNISGRHFGNEMCVRRKFGENLTGHADVNAEPSESNGTKI